MELITTLKTPQPTTTNHICDINYHSAMILGKRTFFNLVFAITVFNCIAIFFASRYSFVQAYNIKPCASFEAKLAEALAKMNRFGPERKERLQQLDFSLITFAGFKEEQIAKINGMRYALIEECDSTNSRNNDKVDAASKKLCTVMLDTYVKNCSNEFRSLFVRKSPSEIKLAMAKTLKNWKKQIEKLWTERIDERAKLALQKDSMRYESSGSFTSQSKEDLDHIWKSPETLHLHITNLALQKDYKGVCNIFADFWYNKESNIYLTEADEDEEDAYYPYPSLPLSKAELGKLSTSQLRQIMTDRNQKCKGCKTKAEYVAFAIQIQDSSAVRNLEKIKRYRKEDL